MSEETGWTPNDPTPEPATRQKLIDLARRLRPSRPETTSGPVAGTPTLAGKGPRLARLAEHYTTARRASSDTSATATAPTDGWTVTPASTTSASATSPTSTVFTDWTVSPIGFVENGYAVNTTSLDGLPEQVKQKLLSLAAGTGEPIGDVVRQVCEFFCDAESEYAEGPMVDALTFYAENQFL